MAKQEIKFEREINEEITKFKKEEAPLSNSITNIKKILAITIIVFVLFAIIASYNLYSLNQKLAEQYNTLSTTIQANTEQLQNKIATEKETLNAKINENKKETDQQYANLTGTIEKTKVENQKNIFTLQDELAQAKTKSDEEVKKLKDSINNIQVDSKDFSAIIPDVVKTVVSIKTDKGSGSGVIIDKKGYLITNYHVIADITKLGIFTSEGKIYAGRLIKEDKTQDIAVLQIVQDTTNTEQAQQTFNFLEFEDSSTIQVGQKVIAVGNPSGLEFSVSEGIISATNRADDNGTPLFQIDAAINPGNSGGPLVTINKKIAGINALKLTGTEALGFAIKGDVVNKFAKSAIKEYEANLQKTG